jgi:hypothetical protein
VFAPESTSIANANYANFAGTLINGTSNITIPSANGNILFSANSNANLVSIETGGILINTAPLLSQNNGLRITSVGRGGNVVGASRIYWAKQRGTIASPLSVEPGDFTAEILTTGSNGTAQQSSSPAFIRAQVDSSYTANGANIPLGWQVQVNDTNGGINNQARTHNFYSNGNVTFNNAIFGNSLSVSGNVNGSNVLSTGNIQGDKLLSNSYVLANSYVQANTFNANYSVSVGNGAVSNAQIFLNGDKTTGCGVLISDAQFSVAMSNVDPTTGFSPFFFSTYSSAYASVSPIRYFRARGIDFANRTSVTTGDYITDQISSVYADSGNTYFDVASQNIIVTNNNGAGNVTANLNFSMNNIGSNINFSAGNTYANILTANYFKGDGSNLSNINGSNVSNVANANYANFAGTLINGNSNISFTAANGSIQFNPVGNANVARIDGNGSMFSSPLAGGYNSWLAITTNYGTAANGASASRISSFRYRGNSGANLSVEPNDSTIDIITAGYNGSILQTSSLARIRANVDASYTANGANIPLGWQIVVNDTNGGINNQSKTHNFYSNGNVTFASSITSTANIQGANVRATALLRGLANTLLGDSSNLLAGTHQIYGNTTLSGNVFVGGGVANGSSLITNYGNNSIQVLDGNITVQNANGNGGYLTGTFMRSFDSLEIRALAQPANIAMYSANGAIIAVGNITGGNANLGNLAIANYFSGNLTGNTSIANLSLTKFQETVVSGGTVSGTLTPNSTAGTIYNYTLNGNITINALGNAVSGTSMTLILTQDGTGNRVLTSSMKFAGGLKTLSTAASATDIMSVFYDGTTYYATLSRGFV